VAQELQMIRRPRATPELWTVTTGNAILTLWG